MGILCSFSLNCMSGKKKEVDADPDFNRPRSAMNTTKAQSCVVEIPPSQSPQVVVEPPMPPLRKRSSSTAKQAIVGEGDAVEPR